eukprot:7166119-Prymnesium_polylepis.1
MAFRWMLYALIANVAPRGWRIHNCERRAARRAARPHCCVADCVKYFLLWRVLRARLPHIWSRMCACAPWVSTKQYSLSRA